MNLETIVAYIVVAIILVSMLFSLQTYYRYVWNRGHRNPAWLLLIVWLPLVVLLLGYLGPFALAPKTWLSYFFRHQFTWAIASTAAAVASTVVVRMLAKRLVARAPRAFGPHRSGIPYRFLLVVDVAVVCVLTIYGSIAIWGDRHPTHWLQAAVACAMFAPALASLHRRQRAAERIASPLEDIRAPVLYLRAFVDDEEQFPPLRSTMQQGTQVITFERFFSNAISEIGPLVALGSPGDYLPPEGVQTHYARDASSAMIGLYMNAPPQLAGWQRDFYALSESAVCILVKPSVSESLAAELASLKARKLLGKTFVALKPERLPGRWNKLFGALGDEIARAIRRAKGVPVYDWQQTARCLASAGLELGTQQPPAGSILAFQTDGRSSVIASGLHTPKEYVDALVERLGSRTPRAG